MKLNIGILAQKKEKNIDGINRVTTALMSELIKLDQDNEYSFIGKTDWLDVNIPYFNIVPDTRGIMDLNYAAAIGQYDIIHSHYRPFQVSKSINCATVLTIHDLLILKNKYDGPYNYFDKCVRECAKNVDLITADSQSTKNDIVELYGIDESKIKVIYNGFSVSNIDESKISYNIKQLKGENYIVAVSTMRAYKNIDGLVRAFNVFKSRYPHNKLKLVLTGKNDKTTNVGNNIKEILEKRDDIIFTGYVSDSDLSWLYKNAICSSMVSFYEGFGLPVLESLSFGKTVICSNTSSLPEVGGDAVEYCNPYDIESMADAIERVVMNDLYRICLEKKAREQVAKFSYEKMAKEMVSLYKKIV